MTGHLIFVKTYFEKAEKREILKEGLENRRQPAVPEAPPLVTALQEQAGLKLESRKVPVDGLVVDHAEPPTANRTSLNGHPL